MRAYLKSCILRAFGRSSLFAGLLGPMAIATYAAVISRPA